MDDPLQWCWQAKKFFSFAVMMLNINSEPAQQNTVCFILTAPMAFTGSSWGAEIKRNEAAGTVGASSCSRVDSPYGEWGFNRSKLLHLTKVRHHPPPRPVTTNTLPSVFHCCQWTNLASGRCAATFPQSLFPKTSTFSFVMPLSNWEQGKE